MATRRNWQRDELLLALNLYCRLPFGQYHHRNPKIIELANFIGRTPNAVAMKLSNFASFDPYHQGRGIKGLPNAGLADQEIWNEFSTNWDDLAVESEIAYAKISGEEIPAPKIPSHNSERVEFTGLTEAERTVKVRLGQQFFRKVILTSYANKCCICGMPIPDLLIASHIVPWRDNENLRVNPHNGLCLCALHDKGFDRGYFTISEDLKVIIGKAIRSYLPNSSVNNGFKIYEGQAVSLPDKFVPNQEFLAIHRENYFLG